MSTIEKGLSVFRNKNDDEDNLLANKAVKVYVRLMFLRIGEIDTLNEKYQAQASIEARWTVETNRILSILSSDEQKRLTEGKSVSLLKYAELHWHPQLYIENALGDLKEQIRYTAKKPKEDNQIYVCEHRDIKGLFWEKLELHHFPSDVQDLSISVASMLYNDRVILLPDGDRKSGVNREAFVDQQEWNLYSHVDTQQRYVTEFLLHDSDDEDDDNDRRQCFHNSEDRKRSILTVTCHAARQSNYFYWNGYCLILLITLMSFCIFAVPPDLTANRIQTSCTLLLTSITFRWTVNRSLPTISYLTSMDKYAILCIFILVTLCIWHACLGSWIFVYTPNFRTTQDLWLIHLDHCVFLGAISVLIIIHIVLLTWLYYVPLKCRRQMAEKDIEYRQSIRKEGNNMKYSPLVI
ncbi:unnamed protein product [Adineta ricciae]|uniref:Neurotransmitter-gated ion-channel transmembrane domain-containing protein n=1 Tax=Adineta ricciae TaxID=249248 RepID=A0A815LSN4_ADIRI|nr:unnamed protein product [Adineta ricciae]CAF1414226.1 unnamed protein product [Adineta ricciae]